MPGVSEDVVNDYLGAVGENRLVKLGLGDPKLEERLMNDRRMRPSARAVKYKNTNFPLAFRASPVVSSSPLEGVAFRGCEKRRWRAGISTMKKTGKVQ